MDTEQVSYRVLHSPCTKGHDFLREIGLMQNRQDGQAACEAKAAVRPSRWGGLPPTIRPRYLTGGTNTIETVKEVGKSPCKIRAFSTLRMSTGTLLVDTFSRMEDFY